jgi:hypothetical protein
MRRRTQLAALICATGCCFQAFSQGISISISWPYPGAPAVDAVPVAVSVQSVYEVANVQASVEGRGVSLVYSPAMPGWTNVISLPAGLPRGSKTLTVTASDVFGNSAQKSVTFLIDRPPQLTVLEPLEQSVARPHIRVRAYAVDDDPNGCQVSVYIGNAANGGPPSLSGTNAISGSITSVAGADTLWFLATDSARQNVWIGRPITFENSTNLVEVFAAPGPLLDVTGDAAFYYTSEEITCSGVYPAPPAYRQPAVKFRSRISGEDTVLPIVTNHVPAYNVITGPRSALITYSNGVYPTLIVPLVELNEDSVLTVADSVASLSYAGGRVAFDSSQQIRVRDLLTGSNVYSTAGSLPKLAENGDLLFSGGVNPPALFLSRLSDPSNPGSRTNATLLRPAWSLIRYDTDGTNVVYHRQTSTNFQLVILTPAGEETVTSSQPFEFIVNSGWVAYSTPGSSGQTQVWTRSPSGAYLQRTFFSAGSALESLNSNGELTFTDPPYAPLPGNRYLSIPGVAQSLRISSRAAGRPKWINGALHIMLGRSLFRPVHGNLTIERANAGEWWLHFQGIQGFRHQLQTSSNLVDWTNLSSFTNSTGTYEYLHGNNARQRYYRTVLDTQ